MKRFGIVCFATFLISPTIAQVIERPDESAVGQLDTAQHVLMGDFRVQEGQSGQSLPQNFQLELRSLTDVLLGRQNVTPNSQYRFDRVRNGEYSILVLLEGRQVARVPVYVMGTSSSYVRHDIDLAWQEIRQGSATAPGRPTYARSTDNQELLAEAQQQLESQQLDEAANLLSRVVESDPDDFEAWTALGSVLFQQEKFSDAEAAFKKALKARPGFPVARVNLGKLHLGRQRYSEAIEVLEQGLGSAASASLHYFLGEAYLQNKKGSKAVEHFKTALEKDPDGMADAHLRMAALYHAAGYRHLAAEEYRQYLNKRPESPDRKEMEKYITENKQPQ